MKKQIWLFLLVIIVVLSVCPKPYAAPLNFIPEFTLSSEYTDNLDLTYDEDLKVDDTIITAGLSFNFDILGQTAGFDLTLSPSYNMLVDNDQLNYWRYFVDLRTYKDFTRNTRIELSSTYLETEDPRDSTIEALGEGETDPAINVDRTRRTRNRFLRNINVLRLSHQFGVVSNVYLALGYNIWKDIDITVGGDVDDYNELRPEFGVEYWFERQWGFAIDASMADRNYDDRNDRKEYIGTFRITKNANRHLSFYLQYEHTILDFQDDTLGEDYEIIAPSLGLEYQFRENTFFRLGAGYYIQDFNISEDDDQSFIEAEINQEWVLRTTSIGLIINSGYDIEDTGSEDLGLNVFYAGRLEAIYEFSPRFSWDAFGSYRYDDYPNAAVSRIDRTQNAGTGISYQVVRWMELRLSYEFEDVSSDLPTEEFTENRVAFTIRMVPHSPYRLN